MSAVTVVGFPAEVYSYGISIGFMMIAYALGLIIAGLFYLPVFHKLKLTSIFEVLTGFCIICQFTFRPWLVCLIKKPKKLDNSKYFKQRPWS